MQSQPTLPPPTVFKFSIQTTRLEYSNYPKIFLKKKIVFEIYSAAKSVLNGKDGAITMSIK